MFGLRVSSGFQLVLSSLLVVVIAVAIAIALPARGGRNWTPFAPDGWWAIGTAANILVWLFVGWEAVAQLAGDFRDPTRDLPRAMALAFGVVTVLYAGLAAATIAVTAGTHSRVPLADIIHVGFGRAGSDATAVLAVALTMGTMNVYISGSAKLIAALAQERALPAWLAGDAYRSVPRRPLLLLGMVGVLLLGALIAGLSSTDDLVRATSACFIAVYALALLSAIAHPDRPRARRGRRHARARRLPRRILVVVHRRADRRRARSAWTPPRAHGRLRRCTSTASRRAGPTSTRSGTSRTRRTRSSSTRRATPAWSSGSAASSSGRR